MDPLPQAPMTGNLLIASAAVTDPMYVRGVCLLVHDDSNGIIGVMLNRPLQPNPEAMAQLFGESSETGDRTSTTAPESVSSANETPLGQVHFGGPHSGPVFAIHQNSQCAEAETGSGIFLAAQKQHLETLVRQKANPYRLIVGHLGWNHDQLNSEIDAGIWHPLPATAETVFADSTEMWPALIRRATSRSLSRWLAIPDQIGPSELN